MKVKKKEYIDLKKNKEKKICKLFKTISNIKKNRKKIFIDNANYIRKGKNININNLFFNNMIILLIIIIILILFPVCLSKKNELRKLNLISEITITIKGDGIQYILSNETIVLNDKAYIFGEIPTEILVNGSPINYTGKVVNSLINEDNNITMKWDEQITDCTAMFYGLSNIIYIDFSKFDSSKVTDMKCMFYDCTSLTSINFYNFNTSSVVNMNSMFYGCNSLEYLDLNIFDTSSVTNMEKMFSNCNGLKSLYIDNFRTKKVTKMSNMFNGCRSLLSLNLKSFDTSSVSEMSCLFYNCNSLTSLNLKNFNTSSILWMDSMFFGCMNLKSLNLKNFNTSLIAWMNGVFSYCYSLEFLDVSSFDTSKVIRMDSMFRECRSLKFLNLKSFDTSSVTRMDNMFRGSFSLISLNLSNFDTSKVDQIQNMFEGCKSLISLDLRNFDTSSVVNETNIFSECNKTLLYCINGVKASKIMVGLSSFNNSNCSDNCFIYSPSQLIVEKTKCIDFCSNDNIYRFEYNNLCYESCPSGTHNSSEKEFLCEEDLICENYYNYNYTDCLDKIPEGYYLNDSALKTIDKCNIKCKECTFESTKSNLCISCNNNENYFSIVNESSNSNSFVNCYNQEFDGFYLDINESVYKPCYSACKKCNELGDKDDNKCIECYSNFTLNNANCYEIYKYNNETIISDIELSSDNSLNDSTYTGLNTIIFSDDTLIINSTNIKISDSIPNNLNDTDSTEKSLDNITSIIDDIDSTEKSSDNITNILDETDSTEKSSDIISNILEGTAITEKISDSISNILEGTDTSEKISDSITNILDNIDITEKISDSIPNNLNDTDSTEKSSDNITNIIDDIDSTEKSSDIISNIIDGTDTTEKTSDIISNILDDTDSTEKTSDIISNILDNIDSTEKTSDSITNNLDDTDRTEKTSDSITNILNGTDNNENNNKLNNLSDYITNEFYNDEVSNNKAINKFVNELITSNNISNKSVYFYEINLDKNELKSYSNITFIDFPKETKKFLIKQFNLDEEKDKIYILIIDTLKTELKSATSDYYYKFVLDNGTELNLSNIDENFYFDIYVPLLDLIVSNFNYSIHFVEQGYDIYDKKGSFYNDICSSAFINESDITLDDRKKDIYPNNVTLCKENCEYKSINIEEKRIICECNLNLNSNITKEYDNFLKEENEDDGNFFSYLLDNINYKIFKCFKLLIFDNMKKNYAFYGILFILFIMLINNIIFCFYGIPNIRRLMNKHIPTKQKVYNDLVRELRKRKNIQKYNNLPTKYKKRKTCINTIYIERKTRKNRTNTTRFKKGKNLELVNSSDNKMIGRNSEHNKLKKVLTKEEDFDDLPFTQAIRKDKRGFLKIFISVLMQKIDIVNLIFGNHKVKIILIYQYILSLLIDFFFNAFLYSDDIVSQKYHNNGKLDFIATMSLSLASNIITSIICNYFNFSKGVEERLEQIMDIKREFNYLYALNMFIKVLKIRVFNYMLIEIIFISFSFYYILIFCIVYNNSQISLLVNYIISLLESLIASIVISLIIVITRKIGIIYLNNTIYNTSKYINDNF